MSQTIFETCRLVSDPSGCYVEEPLSNAAIAEFALEPMVKRVGSNPRQREPELRLRPLLARLEGGRVFGLTFVPVTQNGFASLNFFVHNPMNLNKIINGEDPEDVDFSKKNLLLCQFSGIDDYDAGVLVGNSENFGHWMFNHFSRLALILSVPALRDVPLIVGENISANQLECLALMGFDQSRILRLRKGRLARFRMLWAPTMPLCGLSGNNVLLWAPHAIRFFRQKLNIERARSGEKRRRLFISRKGAKWRRLLNEEELVHFIEKSGFEIVDPGVLSIAEQISLAASAEAIMGQIGAGMNMILFAPPGTAVIQLVAHSSVVMNLTEPVATYLKQKYFEINCLPVLNEGVNPLDADSIVSLERVQRALHLFGLSERAPCC